MCKKFKILPFCGEKMEKMKLFRSLVCCFFIVDLFWFEEIVSENYAFHTVAHKYHGKSAQLKKVRQQLH